MIRRRLLILAVVLAAFAPAACADATGPRQTDTTSTQPCVGTTQGSNICT